MQSIHPRVVHIRMEILGWVGTLLARLILVGLNVFIVFSQIDFGRGSAVVAKNLSALAGRIC